LRNLATSIRDHKLLYAINALLAVLFLLPFLWSLSTSLKPTADITKTPPRWIPDPITFEHYEGVWNAGGGIFRTYFANTLILTVFTVLFVTLIGAVAGYGFAKLDIPFRRVLFVLILATLMVPFHALLIPLFSLMRNLDLLNTHAALIIIYVTFQLPFAVFMMTNTFDAMPSGLREASLTDGANELQTFIRIMLPLSWPGLATVAIFSAYHTWNDFIVALVFTTTDEMRTLNVGLTNFALGQYATDWGALTSGSILSSIPIVVLFAFLQRYFIRGLTTGAVK
jgi:ABC-type glycerol-3-phosphate transport system permease component